MINIGQNNSKAIFVSVFLISVSLFAYQVALTRIYSAILSYHYVFLTTSFAILGAGAGSIIAYKDRTRLSKIIGFDVEIQSQNIILQLSKWTFALALSFVCVFALIYVQPFIDNLIVYIILGLIPFIISGYLFSMLFKFRHQVSGKMYFADLVGAGGGSIAIVFLLNSLGMFKSALIICLIPLVVAVVLPMQCKALKIARYAITALLIICLFLPMQMVHNIETNFYALLNNSGKSFGEMRRSGLEPEIVFSRWDSFARTDLISIPAIPQLKILTIDGAANAPMYVFDGDLSNMDHFKVNAGYIPFAIDRSDNALVIGAGGGRGVLYALAGGSTDIAAVEINPASILAARTFGDFNGNIFDRPEVQVYAQDGRNFVRTTEQLFDVIFLSLVVTNTTQGVGFALSENYIHTVEAMEDYLGRLSDVGRVAFVTHDHESMIRLTATALEALVNRGVPLQDAPNHIALYHQDLNGQIIAPTIIIKNQPFSESNSLVLLEEIMRIGFDPLHIPIFNEWPPLSTVASGLFMLEQFNDIFEFRATPATDDSPYFFHFERGVPGVLLQILIFSLLGAILLTALNIRKKSSLAPSLYFALLGMGFMMVQIPLIQKFILYLGHPTPAFSYVLAAMLIGCGAGGYFSSRKVFNTTVSWLYIPPIIAAVICIGLIFSLQAVFEATAGLNMLGKMLISSAAVILPGFFMGMPFPRAAAMLGQSERDDMIPLMWGINGVTSVTGSVLSIILSMTFGFTAALMTGAAIYVAIGFFKRV